MIWANPETLVAPPLNWLGVLAKCISELSELVFNVSKFHAILLRGVWIFNPFLGISGNSTHAHSSGIDIIIIYMYISGLHLENVSRGGKSIVL